MIFHPYPQYKDSGVEWLGEVPEHWEIMQLRYLGRFRKGLTITRANLIDTGVPCLNYGEVHSSYPFEVNQDKQELPKVSEAYCDTDPTALVGSGDLVFADTSEDLEGVGNFTHISGIEPVFAGYHTIIFTKNTALNSRFLAYSLDSFALRTQLRTAVKGVKVFSITQEILRCGTAWLPPAAEQDHIEAFLDHETGKIDGLIAEQEKLIELLKEKRQATISHAVTKGLNPDAPMKDSGVEWLGEVPEHWKSGRLKHLITIRGGQDHKAVESKEPTAIPVIGSGGQFSYANQHLYEGESVLLGRKGTIDKPLYITGKFWTVDTMFYSEIHECANGKFVHYAATNIPFDLYSTNTALPSMSQFDLSNHAAVFPDKKEQTEIVKYLDRETAKLDTLLSEAQRGIELLKERRSALISAAVTGKIDVRNWKPQGEAA